MPSTEIQGSCETGFERVGETFSAGFASGAEIGAAVSMTVDGRPVVDLWGGWCD